MDLTTCPCCGSSNVTTVRQREQSNGMITSGHRCPDCQFSFSAVNGVITKSSRHSIDKHRAAIRAPRLFSVH